MTVPLAKGEAIVATGAWMAKPGQRRRLSITATPLDAVAWQGDADGAARARSAALYPEGRVFSIRVDRGAAGITYATEHFGSLAAAKEWAEARWAGLAWDPA